MPLTESGKVDTSALLCFPLTDEDINPARKDLTPPAPLSRRERGEQDRIRGSSDTI